MAHKSVPKLPAFTLHVRLPWPRARKGESSDLGEVQLRGNVYVHHELVYLCHELGIEYSPQFRAFEEALLVELRWQRDRSMN